MKFERTFFKNKCEELRPCHKSFLINKYTVKISHPSLRANKIKVTIQVLAINISKRNTVLEKERQRKMKGTGGKDKREESRKGRHKERNNWDIIELKKRNSY